MRTDDNDIRLDELIRVAIGRNGSPFDFERWRQGHQRQIEEFRNQIEPRPACGTILVGRRATMTRTLKIAVAALVFIGVCLGVPYLGHQRDNGTAFAQVIEQIEKAKTITWKLTFYSHVVSKDGQKTWVETETREMAYKAPGLYREVLHPTVRGQIEHVCITDAVNLRSLSLVAAEKARQCGRVGDDDVCFQRSVRTRRGDEQAGPAVGGQADGSERRGERLSAGFQR